MLWAVSNRTENRRQWIKGVLLSTFSITCLGYMMPAAAITLSKSFIDDPVQPGDTVTQRYEILNTDTVNTATDISFTEDFEAALAGLTALGLPSSDACGAGSTLNGTSVLTFTGGSLPPGGACQFDVTLQVPAGASDGEYTSTTSGVTATIGGTPTNDPPASSTLRVLSALPPAFSKAFAPDTIAVGATSTLTFVIDNTASGEDATELDVVDNLPAGVVVGSAPNASSTCSGGTLSAVPGSATIGYSGGAVTAGSDCTLSVTVRGETAGDHVNTTGDLTSSLGNSGAATATLSVMDNSIDPGEPAELLPIPVPSLGRLTAILLPLLVLALAGAAILSNYGLRRPQGRAKAIR